MDPSMYRAATCGDVGFLQKIRNGEVSADLLSHRTPFGNSVLHLAAEFKQINFFTDVSLDKQSPLFWSVNKMKDTPLHIAARVGCNEVVDFLIEHAKSLHRRANDQEKGPTYAKSYKKLLRKTNSKRHTALHVAAQYGHHGVVILLMKADPELCCSNNSAKESPLFLATCKGFPNIVGDILNEPSISPSFRGIKGVTALHAAVSHTYQGVEEIVKSMVSKCPDMIRKVDALGWTPLHYAAFRGNFKAVTLLMESDKFSTSYILDKHGMTALHVPAYKGHIEVMKELIQYQPDTCECVNAKDQTILHVAVLGAQSDVVKYILKLPEFPRLLNQADEDGYTPLQLAVMGQNHEIIAMLNCGVDTASIDNGFSLVFGNFLGDIKLQILEEKEVKEVKGQEMNTVSSHQGRSFGVPFFREQIGRDFKKFESQPKDKHSGRLAISGDREKMKSGVNSLMATLIATVTFAAALTPPGGFGDDGKAILQDDAYFKWFQLFNLLSFCFSFMVLLMESYVVYVGPRICKAAFPFNTGVLMFVSLFGMGFALLAGSVAMLNKKNRSISADPPTLAISLLIVFFFTRPYLIRACRKAWNSKVRTRKISHAGGVRSLGIRTFLSK